MKKILTLTSFVLITFYLSSNNLFAQFIWTKYPGNPILSADSSNSWCTDLYMPCVVHNVDSSRLEMFFSAHSKSDSSSDHKPQQIGLAFSNDPVSWKLYEFPVLTPGNDRWGHYSVESPFVILHQGYGGIYQIYYTGLDSNLAKYSFGYGWSSDGINWSKSFASLRPRENSWESGGIGWSNATNAAPYIMLFTGIDSATGRKCIGYATTETFGASYYRDSITEKNNPVLKPGDVGVWDDYAVFSPKILRFGGGFLMVYNGYKTTKPKEYHVGLAISADGISWEKYSSNPIFSPSKDSWDSNFVELGSVHFANSLGQPGDTLYMYYVSDGDSQSTFDRRIGLAKSELVLPCKGLLFNQTKIDFGNLKPGTVTDTVTVTLKNGNYYPVKIISVSNSKAEFRLLELPDLPIILSEGDSIRFKVCFNPQTFGKFDDQIQIVNNDYYQSIIRLPLSGNVLLMAPKFQAFYDYVNSAATIEEKNAIVDSFMNVHPILPYIEDSIAHFIYYGEANAISVPCDANDFLETVWPMYRISGTSLWFRSQVFEMDARIDYRFENNLNLFLDPRNPRVCPNAFGGNSELVMPNYVDVPEIQYHPEIPHGLLIDTTITSIALGNSRPIKIYLPPEYDLQFSDSFGVALFNDGLDFINFAKAQNVFDYLIDKKRIQPLIGIFVPPVERDSEYAEGKTIQYETFIVNELMPYVDSRFRTKKEPNQRAMIGISYGGLITTQICYNHPDCFGLAGQYSASYKVNSMQVFSAVLHGSKKEIKWYMDCGTYEPTIARTLFELRDSLLDKDCEVSWRQWHEGHSWGSWRAHLDNALEYFFPGDSISVKVHDIREFPLEYALFQNYPNPFNPTTKISFTIPNSDSPLSGGARGGLIALKIYDVLGNEIITLFNEEKESGYHSIDFNASNLPSGVYFYQLKAGEFISTKKMLLLK